MLISHREFRARLCAAKRDLFKTIWMLLGFLVLPFGGFLLWLNSGGFPAFVDFSIAHEWFPKALLGVLVAVSLAFLVAPLLRLRSIQRRHGLSCPHCHRGFMASEAAMVLAGRHCCHCGERIIEDTPR